MKIVNRTGVLSATLINAESNAYQWMSKTVAVDTEKITNLCYGVTMMNKENNNPYAAYILSKGRDLPTAQPCTKQVPARFVNRFSTYKEYEEAMADFLNGM